MKLNKIILPLLVALVAMSATTGCKKTGPKLTNIPGRPVVGINENQNIDTKPFDPNAGNPGFNPGGNVNSKPGQFATSDTWDPNNCDQDRATFANQTVHFAFDSAAVLTKEESKLILVSEKLNSDPSAKLLIEGHCDERGTEEYNRSLGERRALALREALSRAGIDANRIRTISYGKDKPADSGHDESAWNKNRRGEFILCHLKAGA